MKEPIVCARRKVGRNEPCPFCASGMKFKKCHGAPTVREHTERISLAGHPQEKPATIPHITAEGLGPMVYR